eukprot:scaffold316_cov352-Pavlova_lutheri.AAC.10
MLAHGALGTRVLQSHRLGRRFRQERRSRRRPVGPRLRTRGSGIGDAQAAAWQSQAARLSTGGPARRHQPVRIQQPRRRRGAREAGPSVEPAHQRAGHAGHQLGQEQDQLGRGCRLRDGRQAVGEVRGLLGGEHLVAQHTWTACAARTEAVGNLGEAGPPSAKRHDLGNTRSTAAADQNRARPVRAGPRGRGIRGHAVARGRIDRVQHDRGTSAGGGFGETRRRNRRIERKTADGKLHQSAPSDVRAHPWTHPAGGMRWRFVRRGCLRQDMCGCKLGPAVHVLRLRRSGIGAADQARTGRLLASRRLVVGVGRRGFRASHHRLGRRTFHTNNKGTRVSRPGAPIRDVCHRFGARTKECREGFPRSTVGNLRLDASECPGEREGRVFPAPRANADGSWRPRPTSSSSGIPLRRRKRRRWDVGGCVHVHSRRHVPRVSSGIPLASEPVRTWVRKGTPERNQREGSKGDPPG